MKVLIALVFAFLAGCATTPSLHDQGWAHVERGDLASAEATLKQALQQGDRRAWNSLGVVYQRRGERDKAVQFYNMGARWGDTFSQQNLAEMGLPVPSPDLAANRAQTNAAQAQAMRDASMHLLRPAPALQAPQSTYCTTRRYGDSLRTICD